MALIVETHTITRKNRDHGKTFVITEMAPKKFHKWCTKVLFGLMNAGIDVPDDVLEMGAAGLMVVGIGAVTRLPHAIAEPLLDELLECLQFKIGPVVREVFEVDIEEAMTYFDLQKAVLTMHIKPLFFESDLSSESAQSQAVAS